MQITTKFSIGERVEVKAMTLIEESGLQEVAINELVVYPILGKKK